jgi:hypothetical protein
MAKHIKIKGEEDRKELGQLITEMWDEDNTDRDTWLTSLPKWLDAYQGRPQQKDLPWEGASNLFVPLTATAIDAIHPRLMASLFKPTPIAGFRAQEASDIELAQKNESFLDYVAREECNLFPLADRFILNTLIYGVQVVKASWELETKNQRVRHEFPRDTDPINAIEAILQGEQAYADAIKRITDEEYEVAMKGRKVKLDVEQAGDQLVIYTDREEVTKDQVVVDILNPEDVAFNSDCPYDLQRADHVIERYFLTLDQIKKKVKAKLFYATKAELQEIEDSASSGMAASDSTSDIKDFREIVTGALETWREGSPYEKVELLDAYMKYDINDDGYDEDVIVTIPVEHPEILLRVHRLEDVYAHGMKPFTLFYFNPISKTVWAQGLPQMVEALQAEINIIHNQRNDAGQLNNTPYGWFVPSAGLPKERMPIEPGVLNPVGDVNQVKIHQPGNYHAWPFQEESQLYTLFERRTKVSDLTLGRVGEVQGAARTATGVQALNAQQATGFDIVIRRIQEGWKGLLQQILALYQEYMSDDRMVRITGKYGDPDFVVSRRDLSYRMDMVFTGNSLNTDREVERNTTTFLAQSVMAPPSLGFLMQTQVIDPQGIAEWYRHLFEVFDVPKIERIIKIPEIPKILQPEEIMNRLMTGEKLLPKEGEDHDAVIMMISDYMNSSKSITMEPEIRVLIQGQIPLRQQQKVNEQMQKLQQMMQMMQMAQQQQMMGGGGGMIPPGFGGAPQPPQPPQQGLTF